MRILCVIVLVMIAILVYGFFCGYTTINILHRPKHRQTRIACVGDSITYGMGIKNWPKNNYPAVLQRLLGETCCVNNYGYSNRTLMKTGDHPYSREKQFSQSLAFEPDAVIIMLGTNDAKEKNWRGREHFKEEYLDFLKSYTEACPRSTIFLCTPSTIFYNDGTMEGSQVGREIIPCQNLRNAAETVREIGAEHKLPVVDINAFTRGHRDWFQEGLHPNKEGAEKIAERICRDVMGWKDARDGV